MRAAMHLIVCAAFAGVALLWAGGAEAASFDCKGAANRIEHLICDTPNLDSLDLQLRGAYLGALDRSNHPAQVKEKQQAWLKARDACADAECLSAAYVRQIGVLQSLSDDPSHCNGSTTIEIDTCQAEYAKRADRQLARYVAAVRKRLLDEAKENPDTQAAKTALPHFDASQTAWTVFRKAECEAVYSWYSDGTIRGAMYQGCLSSITHARTADIWTTWLHFEDSTPALMPDPNKALP